MGECVSSISFESGLFPETVWQRPENAELRRLRGSPYVLKAGDRVFVPEPRPKHVAAETGATHRFRRRGVPERYRARLLDRSGRPRTGLPWRLQVDGNTQQGVTDADGAVIAFIPPDAMHGQLELLVRGRHERYELQFGRLEPIDELTGVQARLSCLGYDCRAELGRQGELTRRRIAEFQLDHNLPTGELDPATRQAIAAAYGG